MKYRILIVDDSIVMRRVVRQALESDAEMEVAGVAANGKIALSMVEEQTLDAITLDIEMPEMDGLQTLRELRARGVRTPVIMFSTLTERGALATLDALAAGADDYVAKPANVGNVQESISRIRCEVIPKIKALCWKTRGHRPLAASQPTEKPALVAAATRPIPNQRIDVVAIGSSTGGPNALAEVIPHLAANFPVPIVIVQHMPPTFTRFLAERLTAISSLVVREGITDDPVKAGQVWIAPGDFHMSVCREGSSVRLCVFQAPQENSCRPSVDVLFRSVAEVFGENTLAVVMTGMGQDGLRGCEYIKKAQGQIIVQDEASSVVWGMPGYVAKAGLAERILPVAEIAREISRRVSQGRVWIPGKSTYSKTMEVPQTFRQGSDMGLEPQEFDYLRQLLAEHSAIVLDEGKGYLAESRLTPLAYQVGMESAQNLLAHIRRSAPSVLHRKVLDAMMNNETWFFRDHLPFELLRRVILPELLAGRSTVSPAQFLERSVFQRTGSLQHCHDGRRRVWRIPRMDHLDSWN